MVFEILIALLLAGAVVACLPWSEISSWLTSRKNSVSDYAEIIKERLSNGNYKVIAGVFNKHGVKTSAQTWEAKDLDTELESKFGGSNLIRVEI